MFYCGERDPQTSRRWRELSARAPAWPSAASASRSRCGDRTQRRRGRGRGTEVASASPAAWPSGRASQFGSGASGAGRARLARPRFVGPRPLRALPPPAIAMVSTQTRTVYSRDGPGAADATSKALQGHWLHCCDACEAGPNQECSVIFFRSSRVTAAFSGPARRVWGRAPRRACFFLCPDGISFLCRAEVKSIGAARPAHRGRLARTGRQSCTSVGRFGACGAAFWCLQTCSGAKPPFTGHRVLVRLSHNSGRFSRRYPWGLIPAQRDPHDRIRRPAGCAHLKALTPPPSGSSRDN